MDVMIVDGDAALRGLLADALQEFGMTVSAFAGADEALSSPDFLPPRLLVCESAGEGAIDGVTLATLALRRWQGLRVIYLQADDAPPSWAAREIGGHVLRSCEHILHKPFRLREFLAAVLAALSAPAA